MQEQNFEKQVQQKMEELSFVPTAPVWQKVEEQIKRKKERRRIIFWLLPVLLLTGGVFFWLNETGISSKQEAITPFVKKEQNDKLIITENSKKENFVRSKQVSNNKEQKSDLPSASKNITAISKTLPEKKVAFKNSVYENLDPKKPKELVTRTKQNSSLTIQNKDKEKTASIAQPNGGKQETGDVKNIQPETSNPPVVASDDLNHKETGKDSVSAPVVTTEKDSITAKDSIVKAVKNAKPIVKKKWQWSGYAAAGISKLTKGSAKSMQSALRTSDLLSFNGANMQAAAPAPAPGQSNFFTLNKDFAFSLATIVRRNISQRFSISAGVEYNYFSAWNYVGKSVSNATQNGPLNSQVKASRFYLANGAEKEKYTNKYHYIGIPIQLEWQLSDHIPLQVNAGFNLSTLIGTNALYFDNLRQIYYENKDQIKKNRFALAGGLSYRLWQKKGIGLYAGPQAELSLTNLYKENTSGHRLFFGGLHTEVRF